MKKTTHELQETIEELAAKNADLEKQKEVLEVSNCDNPNFVEGYKKARALARNLAYGRFSVKQYISSDIVPFY